VRTKNTELFILEVDRSNVSFHDVVELELGPRALAWPSEGSQLDRTISQLASISSQVFQTALLNQLSETSPELDGDNHQKDAINQPGGGGIVQAVCLPGYNQPKRWDIASDA
jgi:hypothetical protein